jgi:hypothetical protein
MSWKNRLVAASALLAITSAGGLGSAAATTIDFSTFALGTSISSLDGVSFSLYLVFGSPVSDGSPVIGAFGYKQLSNKPTTGYPTSGIEIQFSAPANNVSFIYDNFGSNTSFEEAFGSTFSSRGIGNCNGCTVSVAGNNITRIYVDNGEFGNAS